MGISSASKRLAGAMAGMSAVGQAGKVVWAAGKLVKRVGSAALNRIESGQRKIDAAKRADVMAIRKRMGDI